MNILHLIVGLGNPGREYRDTRHNAGFMVIDALLKKLKAKLRRRKYYSWTEATVRGNSVVIAKPRQFINMAGEAIERMVEDFNVESEHIVVIYDDADLPLGSLRIRRNGSSGGHRGVESIIRELGTDNFLRMRIGIGGGEGWNLKDYVLSTFTTEERKIIDHTVKISLDALFVLIEKGIDEAMRLFNRKDRKITVNETEQPVAS
ncbi:MAG TPA: aminoacyl-tRNA hydrolase [Candidatus Omnitrophica bacterium]|nr:aminoacyl-tRNA hydrolase [Candidatus Omnitrophota bacterium]